MLHLYDVHIHVPLHTQHNAETTHLLMGTMMNTYYIIHTNRRLQSCSPECSDCRAGWQEAAQKAAQKAATAEPDRENPYGRIRDCIKAAKHAAATEAYE